MALFCCGPPQPVLSRITQQLLSPSKWVLSTESASVHFVTVTCLMPLSSSFPTPGWSPRNQQPCLFPPIRYFLHVFYMAGSAHTQDNGHGWPWGPQKQWGTATTWSYLKTKWTAVSASREFEKMCKFRARVETGVSNQDEDELNSDRDGEGKEIPQFKVLIFIHAHPSLLSRSTFS